MMTAFSSRKQLSSLENEAVLDIMKPKDGAKEDSKIIGSSDASFQLSESQGKDLIKWAKMAMEEKVSDVKVSF